MRKVVEAFFQHKLLLILPIVVIPGIVGPVALLSAPVTYTSALTVWVDHPAYLNYQDGSNPWITPAQNSAGQINELLRTRAFQVDVAQRTTTLPGLVGNPTSESILSDLIARSVTIGTLGDHVLVVGVAGPTAQISYELVNAIVGAYQDKNASDQTDQASAAVSFYQSQIADAQKQLATTGQDLRRYLAVQAANGNAVSAVSASPASPSSVTASLLDPKLASLQASVQQAQSNLNTAQSALLAAQQGASAAAAGQQMGFQVLDQAQMPTAPTRAYRKLLIYPAAAAIAALGLSALILVLLVSADRSVRSDMDLSPSIRVLGTVPSLRLKRVPKKLTGVATRRAIGAAAGMALPAPGGSR